MSDIVKFDDEAVLRAVEVLRRGGLVAIPTETVYGLAADASNGEGVAVYAAVGAGWPMVADQTWLAEVRPHFSGRIVIAHDLMTLP